MALLKLLTVLVVLAVSLTACVPIPPAQSTPAAAPTQQPSGQATAAPAPTQAPSPEAAATQPPSPDATAATMPVSRMVTLDTQGLSYSWQANEVPATPYDATQPPGPKGLPQHVQINFGVTDPRQQKPEDPIMYIIPVTAYEQLWDDAGDPSVSNTITKVYSWTVALQSPPPTSGLPALPPEKIAGVNDLAVQIGRAASDSESATQSGFRFVGRWAQDANPVTAETRMRTAQSRLFS